MKGTPSTGTANSRPAKTAKNNFDGNSLLEAYKYNISTTEYLLIVVWGVAKFKSAFFFKKIEVFIALLSLLRSKMKFAFLYICVAMRLTRDFDWV